MNATTQRCYEPPIIELSRIPVGKYYLLRADNERSRRYVSSLIVSGSLTVREHESWKGQQGIGPQGKEVLHTIERQLQGIFLTMGTPGVETEIKDVIHQKSPVEVQIWKLTIGTHTRLGMYDICREAYRAQRYWHPDTNRWAQTLIPLQNYARQ